MLSTEGTQSIVRPAAEVFAFIADVRNDPRWHTDVLEARLIEGTTLDKGSTLRRDRLAGAIRARGGRKTGARITS